MCLTGSTSCLGLYSVRTQLYKIPVFVIIYIFFWGDPVCVWTGSICWVHGPAPVQQGNEYGAMMAGCQRRIRNVVGIIIGSSAGI